MSATDHFAEGWEAHDTGEPVEANPHCPLEAPQAHSEWEDGWNNGARSGEED